LAGLPACLPACPAHQEGEEVYINQVAACMIYLGEQLGYSPRSPAERARADCILLNVQDFIAAGRLSFHPVNSHASYFDQVEEADRVSLEWSKTKLPVWLAHLEKVMQHRGGGGGGGGAGGAADAGADAAAPVAGGPSITYADFAVFHVLDATVSQFNNEKYGWAWDRNEGIPQLKAFYAAFAARPRLAAYRASDRMGLFGSNSMM
jgi:glutathione S-transferase